MTGQREDALDLTQEAMLRVITGLSGYQVNRPFKPWLRQVVINVCLNFLRRRTPEMLSLDHPLVEHFSLADTLTAGSGDDPQTRLEWAETRDAL